MRYYNGLNVPLFRQGEENGFLCSCCGQPTTKSQSVSHMGFNLWCNGCVWKVGHLLNINDMLEHIQEKGYEMETKEIEKESRWE